MGWWRETIDIVKENDPAARTSLEVLLTYPGVKALAAHRVSHFCGTMALSFWRGCTVSFGVFGPRLRSIQVRPLLLVSLSTMERASLSGKQPLLKKALCSTTGDPWGTGKDVGKRHPTVREGALVSAHAQVIGPVEIGAKAKVGAGAVVVSRCTE